jgi:hypothetical protein
MDVILSVAKNPYLLFLSPFVKGGIQGGFCIAFCHLRPDVIGINYSRDPEGKGGRPGFPLSRE